MKLQDKDLDGLTDLISFANGTPDKNLLKQYFSVLKPIVKKVMKSNKELVLKYTSPEGSVNLRKNVLLVGWGTETSRYVLAECVKLKNYNFYLATTENIPLQIKNLFNKDNFVITNPYDPIKLCEDVDNFIKERKIVFDVVTTFFEMCVYQTAFLAEYLGIEKKLPLKGALKTSVNKYLMRLELERSGLRQPKFLKFSKDSIDEAFRFFKKNCKRAVIKPVHSGHSYGVRFLEQGINFDDFRKLIYEAVSDYHKNYDEWMKYEKVDDLEFLLEEFIEGKIFSFDGFVNGNNKIEFIGGTEFELSNPPVMQQIGHTSPVYSLTEKQIKNAKNYVIKAVKVLGLKYCGFHCELKFCGDTPYLIEISGRLPGAIISRTYQNLSEYNLFDRFFGIFTGNKKFIKNKERFKSESMRIVFTDRNIGIVKNNIENKQVKDLNLVSEIRSRQDGEVLFGEVGPFGIWLYDVNIKSKNLSAKELILERDKLISGQKIKVEESYYLYVSLFFNKIKGILKKYFYV